MEIVLNQIVANTGSNNEGIKLFNVLEEAYRTDNPIILKIDNNSSLSSSFLNSSIGEFLDKYGFEDFKRLIKFRGGKSHFQRIANYIEKYNELNVC